MGGDFEEPERGMSEEGRGVALEAEVEGGAAWGGIVGGRDVEGETGDLEASDGVEGALLGVGGGKGQFEDGGGGGREEGMLELGGEVKAFGDVPAVAGGGRAEEGEGGLEEVELVGVGADGEAAGGEVELGGVETALGEVGGGEVEENLVGGEVAGEGKAVGGGVGFEVERVVDRVGREGEEKAGRSRVGEGGVKGLEGSGELIPIVAPGVVWGGGCFGFGEDGAEREVPGQAEVKGAGAGETAVEAKIAGGDAEIEGDDIEQRRVAYGEQFGRTVEAEVFELEGFEGKRAAEEPGEEVEVGVDAADVEEALAGLEVVEGDVGGDEVAGESGGEGAPSDAEVGLGEGRLRPLDDGAGERNGFEEKEAGDEDALENGEEEQQGVETAEAETAASAPAGAEKSPGARRGGLLSRLHHARSLGNAAWVESSGGCLTQWVQAGRVRRGLG